MMSKISEQVDMLRIAAEEIKRYQKPYTSGLLQDAADTIEALYAKLQELNVVGTTEPVKSDELSCKPGDKVWCIERNEDEDYIDYAGYLFAGVCKDYVLVCPTYLYKSFADQLEEMCEEAIKNTYTNLLIFRRKDVYMTEEEAKVAAQE